MNQIAMAPPTIQSLYEESQYQADLGTEVSLLALRANIEVAEELFSCASDNDLSLLRAIRSMEELWAIASAHATVFAMGSIEQTLLDLINVTYTDSLESIESYQLDSDGVIKGVGIDVIGVNATKRISFEIDDDNIKLRVLNPDDVERFAIEVFAVKKGKNLRPKNCTKGLPCGGSCQSVKNVCTKGLSPEQKQLAQQAKNLMAQGKVGPAVDIPGKGETASEPKISGSPSVNKTPGSKPVEVKPKITDNEKNKPAGGTGGGLATIPKTESEPPQDSQKPTQRDLIDDKFASQDPSPQQVREWLDARIDNDYQVNDENIRLHAAGQAKEHLRDVGSFDHPEIADKIVDRESFIQAMTATEIINNKDAEEISGQKNSATTGRGSPDHWYNEVLSRRKGSTFESKISTLEKKIADPEINETTKKKLKADLRTTKKDQARAKVEAIDMAKEWRRLWTDEGAEANRQKAFGSTWDGFENKSRDHIQGVNKKLNSKVRKTRDNARKEAEYEISSKVDAEGVFSGDTATSIGKQYLKQRFASGSNAAKYGFKKGMSVEEVKRAYKVNARKFHPDTGGSADEFRLFTAVYEQVLGSAAK